MSVLDNDWRLYGCISTEDTLMDKGEMQIKFIEEFQENIAKPLGKLINFGAFGKKTRGKQGDLYDSNWEKAKKLILNEKIDDLLAGYVDFESQAKFMKDFESGKIDYWLPFDYITICFHSKEYEDADLQKSLIEFSVARWIYGDKIPRYITDTYIDLIQKVTCSVKNIGGLITLDFVGKPYRCETGHERYTSITYKKSIMKCDKYFRGYQWGNILSEKHIEILGGKEKVQKEAPVFRTIPLNDGSMFLQLTEDVNNVTDDDLRRLKNYFKPILYMPDGRCHLFPDAQNSRRVIID